jgi:hypothetical protein
MVLDALVRCMKEYKQVRIIRNQQPMLRGKLRVPQPHHWCSALEMEHGITLLPQHPGEGTRTFHRPQGSTIFRIPDEVHDTPTADPESHLLPETNTEEVLDSQCRGHQSIAFCSPPPGWRVNAEGRTAPPSSDCVLPPFIIATDGSGAPPVSYKSSLCAELRNFPPETVASFFAKQDKTVAALLQHDWDSHQMAQKHSAGAVLGAVALWRWGCPNSAVALCESVQRYGAVARWRGGCLSSAVALWR